MEPFTYIPLSVPNLKGNEAKYMAEAIASEWVSTAGPYVTEFEQSLAAYVGMKDAVSCQSGTAGLHLALQVAGVSRDQEVIVPTITFIGAVNPVAYLGAYPVFMDCDDSLCMDMVKLEQFCREECNFDGDNLVNRTSGRIIKALLVVHIFGNMADMAAAQSVAGQYNLRLIEDATEALGTYYTKGAYQGEYAGTIGDIGVYSFNGNKIITTGGGGMIVSNDDHMLNRIRYLSTQAKDDPVNFIHHEIGYNYRMTNIEAALGLAQLEQLETFIATKKTNYELYKARLKGIPGLELLPFRADIRSNYWFYSLYVDEQAYGLTRQQLFERLEVSKIQTRPIWGLIHQQRPYASHQAYRIEKALDYYRHILNLPCSSNLQDSEVERVVSVLQTR